MSTQEELLQAIRQAKGRVWLGIMSYWLSQYHGLVDPLFFPQDVLRLNDAQAQAALSLLPDMVTTSGCRQAAIATLLIRP